MFSGIIREMGTVVHLETGDEKAVLGIKAPMFAADSADPFGLGDSVAISGVCLTVVKLADGSAWFDLASETRRKTTLGLLEPGSIVNLERSLRFGERLDGHLVQGHVEAVGEVLSREDEGNTFRFLFSLPPAVAPYVAPKGSICIDGVSLTVGEVSSESFAVYIIPHTMKMTTFDKYRQGTKVNLESDCIARYLEQLARPYLVQAS